jgi:peptide-methionine (S)-S-oxide reductase
MDRHLETVYLAGGCLWGTQEFLRHLPGVVSTEAGRANGSTSTLDGPYDGYAECVRTTFDPSVTSLATLLSYFFEAIDPYSVNKQGNDVGPKYRTGIYSTDPAHLETAREYIASRPDAARIAVEVLPLSNYVRSAEEHQDYLQKHPGGYCHIPPEVLSKYATH